MREMYFLSKDRYINVLEPSNEEIISAVKELDGIRRRNICLNINTINIVISMDETGQRILIKYENLAEVTFNQCIVERKNVAHRVFADDEPDVFFSMNNGEGFDTYMNHTLSLGLAIEVIDSILAAGTLPEWAKMIADI